MPQMAPMNWLFISPLTIFICLITLTIIYFSFNVMPHKTESSTNITKTHPNFKW
uniref:ATP synthase F0 subunit 8 n=1 Tax=Parasitus fimetorum TaxID=2022322 RepID=UPI001FB03EBC|nr:ATP synthase F0 subunit 8 [Parasitus fimetorum]UKO33172.1 ATP synthase subunit 8 [Parasitus fimetorum]